MGEHYSVLYNGKNLYYYKMKNEEKLIIENFRKELMDICNTLEVPRAKLLDGSLYMGRFKDNDEYFMKYSEEIGYFVLLGERGVFNLHPGFPTKERIDAKYILLESEFFNGGLIYELENRKKLKTEWNKKYKIKYDSRKASFEYTIKLLKVVFNEYPDRTITYYTECMNKWFNNKHWYFDKNKMMFEVNSMQ